MSNLLVNCGGTKLLTNCAGANLLVGCPPPPINFSETPNVVIFWDFCQATSGFTLCPCSAYLGTPNKWVPLSVAGACGGIAGFSLEFAQGRWWIREPIRRMDIPLHSEYFDANCQPAWYSGWTIYRELDLLATSNFATYEADFGQGPIPYLEVNLMLCNSAFYLNKNCLFRVRLPLDNIIEGQWYNSDFTACNQGNTSRGTCSYNTTNKAYGGRVKFYAGA